MFKELHGLATHAELTMRITAAGEMLRIIVIPKPVAEAGCINSALTTPLVVSATPDELNQEFTRVLREYATSRKSLSDTLEETKAYMDAAKQEAVKKATDAAKNTTKKAADAPAAPVTANEPKASEAVEQKPADELSLF
jgi:PRTRC genetic system protein E